MDVKLIMFKANGQRKDFPIINPVTVIGRGEDCDLQIPLLSVSRRHCEISVAGNSVKAKDLASSNGTYVNNNRVVEVELKPGDRLVVGPVLFTIQVDGAPEQIKPVQTKGQRKSSESEDVLELEADVVAQPGASVLQGSKDAKPASKAKAAKPAAEDDDDPIAALEALASEDDDKI